MSEQDSLVHIDIGKKEMIIESIISASTNVNVDASVTPPPTSSTVKIQRVPQKVRETGDYEKEYVPKVVSIGPYHFGNPKLQVVEKLKPVCTMKLLRNSDSTLRSLYDKLGDPQMVLELKGFYEEHSTYMFCDEDFTKMMLLDSCFILYCIVLTFFGAPQELLELGDQIYYIKRDFFLLENQIPFKVLREVTELVSMPAYTLWPFVYGTIFSSLRPPKILKWLRAVNVYTRYSRETWESYSSESPDHLLHLLHLIVTEKVKAHTAENLSWNIGEHDDNMCNFGTANELVDMGIQFKPSRDSRPRACVKFVKGCLELPPIKVDESTKAKWLNLIAFEKGSCAIYDSWVASYVCFLHSLIEQPEDVKVLRKAWVLGNFSGRSKDVVKLFDEIATGLVPDNFAYLIVKNKIQVHYESWRNTLLSQLKHEYIKSPWSFLALVGASLALFLTAVQTYFTVWSPGQKQM
ncbi:hypothetical protein SSX86_013363 [Deinandra increscens subsp. villosa]|uniref:Uncharacterized protein n=1 Tax=Deinandra increscens subsp. villosa TaxID=3103831 RepID=A0AAP0DAI4_9ASTR